MESESRTRWVTPAVDVAVDVEPSSGARKGLVVAAVVLVVAVAGGAFAFSRGGEPASTPLAVAAVNSAAEVVDEPTEEAQIVPAAHLTAVSGYWRDRATAWSRSADEGITFVAERLHPDLAYGVSQCRRAWFPDGVPDGFAQRMTLVPDTLELDPDFSMSHGPLSALPLRGTVYRMAVDVEVDGFPSGRWKDRVGMRLVVVDDVAHGLAVCIPEVAASTAVPTPAPAPAPGAAPAPAPFEPAPYQPAPFEPAPYAPTPNQPAPPPMPAPAPVPAPAPAPSPTLDDGSFSLVMAMIDAALQSGQLEADGALDLLREIRRDAPLTEGQREVVDRNIALLTAWTADPTGPLPRLWVTRDVKAGPDAEATPATVSTTLFSDLMVVGDAGLQSGALSIDEVGEAHRILADERELTTTQRLVVDRNLALFADAPDGGPYPRLWITPTQRAGGTSAPEVPDTVDIPARFTELLAELAKA